MKTECKDNAERDYSDTRPAFVPRCIDDLLTNVRPTTNLMHWPVSLPNPSILQSLWSKHSVSTKFPLLGNLAPMDETRSVVSWSNSSPSTEGVLDLSTRNDPGLETISNTDRNMNIAKATHKPGPSKSLEPFNAPHEINQIKYFQSALSWLPSYQLLLATKEYMDVILQKSTSNISLPNPSGPAPRTLQENSTCQELSRLYLDQFCESQLARLAATDESKHQSGLDIQLTSSADPLKKSIFPNNSTIPSPNTTMDPILNPLFNSAFNTPSSRYSPPLNFSAFTSLDQNMICPICRKCFRFEKNLLRHLQKTHATGTGESVLKCKLCNYTTRHYSNMYVHIRTHTGDKPYSCSACGVSFTQGSSLKLHIRSRHEDNSKYFSLTRKPGKNNLTKLWTRVLKKDLPKYNSAMANTLLNRSKYWTRPDVPNAHRLYNPYSKLFPGDLNLTGLDRFAFGPWSLDANSHASSKSMEPNIYSAQLKSLQDNIRQMTTEITFGTMGFELTGAEKHANSDLGHSSNTDTSRAARETSPFHYWSLERKRRLKRNKFGHSKALELSEAEATQTTASVTSLSGECGQNTVYTLRPLKTEHTTSPVEAICAPRVYGCEQNRLHHFSDPVRVGELINHESCEPYSCQPSAASHSLTHWNRKNEHAAMHNIDYAPSPISFSPSATDCHSSTRGY